MLVSTATEKPQPFITSGSLLRGFTGSKTILDLVIVCPDDAESNVPKDQHIFAPQGVGKIAQVFVPKGPNTYAGHGLDART